MKKGLTKEEIISFNDRKEAGVKAVFNKYYKELLVYIYTILKDFHEAEDVTMIAFWHVIKSKTKFANEEHIRRFITLACKRQAIDYLRSLNKKHRTFSQDISTQENSLIDDGGDWRLKEELLNTINDLVETLPPICKQVVKMRLAGAATGEISNAVNVCHGTVAAHYSLAVKKIKKLITQ